MQSANNKNSTGNDWLWRFLDEVLYPAWLKGLNHNCIQICMSRQWQATTTLSRVWWREIALFNYFPRCFRIDSEMESCIRAWLLTDNSSIYYRVRNYWAFILISRMSLEMISRERVGIVWAFMSPLGFWMPVCIEDPTRACLALFLLIQRTLSVPDTCVSGCWGILSFTSLWHYYSRLFKESQLLKRNLH